MKSVFHILVVATAMAALPLGEVKAQAKRKPAAKPTTTKSLPKPTAKPAPTATSRPTAPATSAPDPEPSLLETALPTTFTTGPFEAGNHLLNLGIGVGSRYTYGMKVIGGTASVSPAVSLSYERGLLAVGPGVLGAGIFAGYQGATYSFNGGGKWKYTDVIMTLRGAFHYPVLLELDAYGGVGVGVRHAAVSYEGSVSAPGNGNNTEVAYGLFVGARYFLFQNLGAFAELGYDQTYLKIGLTGKF